MKQKIIAVLLALVALLGGGYAISNEKLGAVNLGQEYQSTTTSPGRFPLGSTVLCSTPGTLGAVTITGAAAGSFQFFNATTSNGNGRAASSTLLLADIPNSLAVGDYPFENRATTGLLLEVLGTIPTTTITYRCS